MTIRVMVVEDSLTVRKRIVEVLATDPDLEIVAETADGAQAIELCGRLRPDVITMDIMLPVMSGMAATEHIMAHFPTPILIVSAVENRGELFRTYDALAAGAVDVLDKPSGSEAGESWERQLIAAVKLVSRIRVITHPRARLAALAARHEPPAAIVDGPHQPRRIDLLAIGASTGGPGAVARILSALPADLPMPVLVVVHIGEPFTEALADWLSRQTKLSVRLARAGDVLAGAAGRVLLAPPGRHMVVRGGRIQLTTDPERHFCRPSVDVLFESVAAEFRRASAACLLTGMGRDGAAGLLAIRRAGGLTIAQDEATSIVYGMPREAVQIGAAEQILPLDGIAPVLVALARTPASSRSR